MNADTTGETMIRLLTLICAFVSSLLLCATGCSESIDSLCSDGCDKAMECGGLESEDLGTCVSECVTALEEYQAEDPTCADLYMDLQECLIGLSCGDIEIWAEGDPEGSEDYPCKSADIPFFVESDC